MRALALIAVALLAAATFVVPQPGPPVPRAPQASAPAPYAVCPLGEAARRTTALPAVGGGEGTIGVNIFSGGEIRADGELAMSEAGTGVLALGELTGLARAPALLALDDPRRSVETVLTGEGAAAAPCGAGSADPQTVLGGSTGEGSTYTLVLANPFAGSATVDIVAASEVGTESDPALEGVVVPSRTVIPVDLSNLLPGRQTMSATVITNEGRVVVGATHATRSALSAVSGLEAALDWYVPFPTFEGGRRSLVLFAPGTAEIPYQLDVYSSDGVVEAAHEGSVPAQGQVVIPAGELLEGQGMVRVVAAGPLTAALVVSADQGRAVVPGVASPGPVWHLPGAGRVGDTRVHVFNPGQANVNATLMAGTGKEIETVEVPASGSVNLPLGARDVGARLEADGPVVVHWTTAAKEGLAGDAAQAAG